MTKYILLAIFSGVISSLAQILLKKSAQEEKRSRLGEYLNWKVIAAYGITFTSMLLMIVVYKGIPYKFGPVLEALTYLYIMILGRWLLGEKVTKKKVIGNLIIAAGVVIFSCGN